MKIKPQKFALIGAIVYGLERRNATYTDTKLAIHIAPNRSFYVACQIFLCHLT